MYCDGFLTCGFIDSSARPPCINYFVAGDCGLSGLSIARGYATFDSQRAAACSAKVQADLNGCGRLGADCIGNLVRPASATGQGCVQDGDCKDPNTGCGGANVCGRVCQAAGGANQPCRSGSVCETGLFCDATSTCVAKKSAGSSCSSSTHCDANSYCDLNQQRCIALPVSGQTCGTGFPKCASTAYCDTTVNTCKSYATVGQACSSASCGPDLYCNYSVTPAVCAARKAGGQTCSSGGECQSYRCENNVCFTPGTLTQPCKRFDDCQSGLTCDDVTRSCEQPQSQLPAGAACTQSARYCEYQLKCKDVAENPDGGVGTAGICAQPAVGDRCAYHSDCPTASHCAGSDGGQSSGTCATSTLGSWCGETYNCQAAHFCRQPPLDAGAAPTCAARLAAGAVCDTDENGCAPPNHCVQSGPTTASCAPLGGQGATCYGVSGPPGAGGCKLTYECVNGKCEAAGLAGQRCLNESCLEGACVGMNRDAGIPGTCGSRLTDGAACKSYNLDECAGFCDEKTSSCASCP